MPEAWGLGRLRHVLDRLADGVTVRQVLGAHDYRTFPQKRWMRAQASSSSALEVA